MSNTEYNTGIDNWTFGEKIPNDWHKYLGPCPACGCRTFDYGGGWRCVDYNCWFSANNPIGNVGSRPEWWNTDMLVMKDGDAWVSFKEGFINIQESDCSFGSTPREAIEKYKEQYKNT